MEVDYHLAKASCTGEWIEAFVYVDVNARNIPINNGRAEYTVRRLSPGARHAFTVLTSNNFVDTGGGGRVSSEFFWPSNPRWQFLPGRNTLPAGMTLPNGECTDVSQPMPSGSVEGDRAALVSLYDATDGANWTNTGNWLSDSPVGQWYGVSTDAGGRVTELDLAENGLTGPIPPDLRNLTRLEELHLYRNSLTGPIPPELGALANLKQLYVDGNGLTGVLPQELVALTMLEELGFFSNPGLCAPTDSAMQRWLQGIDELYGSSCAAVDSAEDRAILVDFFDATGGANWTNNSNWLSDRPMREWHGVATDASGRVNGLLFRGNNLSGEILPSLGNLSNLEALAFHRNQLTGPIPSTLGSLSNLELLGLGGNQLTGPIPTTLGNLSKLELLYVYENELVGTIPPGLGNLTALEEVNLSRNQLQGRIPSELGGLTNLELLRLDRNQLDGPIPTQLGNLNNVEILSLGGNQLSGSIPSSFSGLVNLTELYLWGNELVGTVPGWLGNLTGLEKLELSDNRFDGPIPATLGNLINLDRLLLWGNELTGPVPAGLGSLTRLERLSLSNNQLTGEIPTTLGNLINLDRLHLWGNELTGPVPAGLGSLTRLERLGLSNNQLTGEIPTTLGNLTSLERLWLQNNQLTGTIPAELGNLTKLEIIKLAGNNLTGCIPQGLRAVADNDFDDLGLHFCSQSGASDVTVASRDEEYSYSISVSDAWVEESEGRYSRTSPWSHLSITSLELGNSVTLAQHATWIRDSLKEEWWESASLFETTSFQKVQIDGQDFYSMTYRVQEAPEYCVVDVSELVTVSNALPGSRHGYRIRMWMCEGDAADYDHDRMRTLRRFRVTTQPSTYYGQFLSVNDVVVKAKDTVDSDALYAAGDMVSTMLSGRRDIGDCMANVGAGLAIIPKDEYVTALPEFSHLVGTSDFTGRPRDSFAIRGLGGVKSQPVSATSEEQLLGLPTDHYPHNRFPHIGLITVHEFAHGIQNVCFNENDWEQWQEFYDAALQAGIFPGTHMMHDVYEFFAVLSTAYFEVTDEIGRGAGRDTVARNFPDVFESLEDIYGGAVLPAEYRERRF